MSFKVFNFDPPINTALKECGFLVPTSIPKKIIGLLVEVCDLMGLAQTGTGKTAAFFVLAAIQQLLQSSSKQVRA